MSYSRSCNICGQHISMREMPGSQWVAFDYRTDNPHEHYKKNTNYIDQVQKKPSSNSRNLKSDNFKSRSKAGKARNLKEHQIIQYEEESFLSKYWLWLVIIAATIISLWKM